MIFAVASRRPPGVLSSTTTAGAPSRSARAIPSARYCAITPSTSPVVGRTMTAGPAARAGPATAASASASPSHDERDERGGRRSGGASGLLHGQYAPPDVAGPRECSIADADRPGRAAALRQIPVGRRLVSRAPGTSVAGVGHLVARAGHPAPHAGAAAGHEVEDELAPRLHPVVDGQQLSRRGEPPLELLRLADGHRPTVGLGDVDHPDVDPPHVRLVVVEQAQEAKLRDEPRVELLGPFAGQAAGQVRRRRG